jgi:hypothetical protein
MLEGRVHESGLWDMPESRAQELVGGDIYFHKKQKEPSFFGGKILGYRIHEADDEYKGRIIFRFESIKEHRGVLAGDGGWSYEKKIV